MKYLFVILLFASCQSRECDFKIPEGYALKQNTDGEYAIQNSDGLYLSKNFGRSLHTKFYWWDAEDYGYIDTFSDSCRAKSLLKDYLHRTRFK